MHIREGDDSDVVATNNAFITLQASLGEEYREIVSPVDLNVLSGNEFLKKISLANTQLKIKLKSYYPSARPDLEKDPDGIPIAEIMFQDRNPVFIKKGEKIIHDHPNQSWPG